VGSQKEAKVPPTVRNCEFIEMGPRWRARSRILLVILVCSPTFSDAKEGAATPTSRMHAPEDLGSLESRLLALPVGALERLHRQLIMSSRLTAAPPDVWRTSKAQSGIASSLRRLLYTDNMQPSFLLGGFAPSLSAMLSRSQAVPLDFRSTLIGNADASHVTDLEGYEPPSGDYEHMTPECNRLLNAYTGVCMFDFMSDDSMQSPMRAKIMQQPRPLEASVMFPDRGLGGGMINMHGAAEDEGIGAGALYFDS
jgi:hypothetical protein